jgi:hypothetical protein
MSWRHVFVSAAAGAVQTAAMSATTASVHPALRIMAGDATSTPGAARSVFVRGAIVWRDQ